MLQFGFPWALAGALSIPALIAIYFLLGRSKPRVVSAMFLWDNQMVSPRGGKQVEKLRTPLLFYLELAALLLLVLAALAPAFYGGSSRFPLVVVLDDSYSMTAGDDESPRTKAAEALLAAVDTGRYAPVHLILAGADARLSAESLSDRQAVEDALLTWKGTATTANLAAGIALARDLGGPDGHIWVLTDQAPPAEVTGNVTWEAFGQARANMALINANRGNDGSGGWCMVEVANLSQTARRATLTISHGEDNTTRTVQMAPDEVRRLVFNIPATIPIVTLSLDDDALATDNQVSLTRPDIRTVQVGTQFDNAALQDRVVRAISTSDRFQQAAQGPPDIMISDSPPPDELDPNTWYLNMVVARNAKPLAGPFIRNSGHPLCDGLSFGGSIWGAPNRTGNPDSIPVVTAGNVPLIEDQSDGNRHSLTMFFNPDQSTFHRGPAWPVLFWNLLEWRALEKPGLTNRNLRIGASTELQLPQAGLPVTLYEPDGTERTITPPGRTLLLTGDRVGLYRIRAAGLDEAFAVNSLNRDESNIQTAESGTWGTWANILTKRREFKPLTLPLLLLALTVLAAHWWLVHRRIGGTV